MKVHKTKAVVQPKKDVDYIWTCDYCGSEFPTKKESDKHELTCKKKDGEMIFKSGVFKKIILTIGCIPLPILEGLVVYMYTSEISSRLKATFPLDPGVFLISLFIIALFFNIFIYFKYPKKRFEIIYFSALVIGFPIICFCCYLLFYYFPFVHAPQGMSTVILIYFFIAFVILIFVVKKIIKKIIWLLKKKSINIQK